MERLLIGALKDLIRQGSLAVTTASGARHLFGDGSGAPVAVRFTDGAAQRAFLFDPELRVGELYMDQRLRIEQGSVYDFLHLVLREAQHAAPNPVFEFIDSLRFATRRMRQRNNAGRAQRNVAHHYDLGDALYALFLDADWQYSCAYFETPEQSLEDAQRAKLRHIASKLLIGPQHRVLDIGCGWGGMALYLAGVAGAAEVVGITLSQEQRATAGRRAAERGLAERVHIRLEDYRQTSGRFDRIVSVGMFEHVGIGYYDAFFQHARRLLTDDGVMLLHTIGAMKPPSSANAWLERYIFPGGYVPALSEITPAIERAGLYVTDLEVLRLHYALTLRHWRERFLARRAEAAAMYDERFCRMFEFYLALCEVAFRCEQIVVFQFQLARQQDAVPLTRDYLRAENARLRAREAGP